MYRPLSRTIVSVGICIGTAALVYWIRGGLDPVPPPVEAPEPVAHPRQDHPAEFNPDESTAISPTTALQLMMVGKTGRFSLPGMVEPPVEPAATATTQDKAEVVGVVVNGRPRAYCISEMHTPFTHVINDLVDRVPVTVTFCDRTRCARVFTKPSASDQPLDVGVGGFLGGQMLLRVDGRNFEQNSADIPLQDLEFETMTWQDWKSAHPDTDVCTGLVQAVYGRRPPATGDAPISGNDAGKIGS